MGDSTTMTIEFLRARLLSERSVTRIAQERAVQLAKRVMELEEQLRIMTIQRKKAVKAAVEVLAILETQGIGDFSDVIDSSSNQDESPRRFEGNGDTCKLVETVTASRMQRSKVEDGLFPSQDRSLSWKSHNSRTDSLEKRKVHQMRHRQRQSNFMAIVGSSPKHHLGKSFQKIKQREMRSVAREEIDNHLPLDAHRNAGAAQSIHSDDRLTISREACRSEVEMPFMNTLVSLSQDNRRKETKAGLLLNETDRDEEMESDLEKQAQFTSQYRAEENSQREWEEKYNENKISNLASCKHANQLGVTGNSCEPEEATMLAENFPNYNKEAELRAENTSNTEEVTAQSLSYVSKPNDQTFHGTIPEERHSSKETASTAFSNSVPTHLTRIPNGSTFHFGRDGLSDPQFDSATVNEIETSSQEFTFPAQESLVTSINSMQNQERLYEKSEIDFHGFSSFNPHGHRFLESPSMGNPFSVHSGIKISEGLPLEIQHQPHRTLPQSTSSNLGGVLETLHQAKISLRQEVSRLPTSEIPIGAVKLFRPPTKSFLQPNFSGPKYYDSVLSLTTNRSDVGYARSNSYQTPNRSTVSVGKQYFDPYANSGMEISTSSRYSLPSHLATEKTSFLDGFPKPYMNMRNKMPAGDRISMYGAERSRSDIQRF